VTVLGLDQHEAGALAVARILRDNGFEVIYTGRFNLPDTIAEIAVQEDVDAVGISAHSWEFLHFAQDLVSALAAAEPPIPVVVGGSVITAEDRRQALQAGFAAVVSGNVTAAEICDLFLRVAAERQPAAET
jgi:methylmalonyl-CoA mutase C-terminal domain/subunit